MSRGGSNGRARIVDPMLTRQAAANRQAIASLRWVV
jgi:hypothetical protein